MATDKRKKKSTAPAKPKADKTAKPAPAPTTQPWETAYERGNYAAARRLAKLGGQGPTAASAQEMLDKISVDKIPLIVFGLCFVLISVIAALGLH